MTKKETIILFFIFILLFGLNLYLGKDINWDQMNYHLYGVHLWLENRWAQDYFAGSFQGYLNPVSYFPFYWMVQQGWHPILISSVLLLVHFLNIVFVLLIIKRVSPEISVGALFAVLVLAAITPIFLTVLGTSFNDATCSVFILAAFYLYLKQSRHCYLWMGVLCGISLAFKLTQGVYILAFVALIFAFEKQKIKSLFIYGIFTTIAFVVVHGFWGWHLQREFGSPFFPLFNSIFKSPDFFQASYHDTRFMGDYWGGLFTLPFEMVLPQSWVYIESSNPDIRIALCVVLFVFYAAYLMRHKLNLSAIESEAKLVFFFFASFILWALLSRIGRYAVTALLLAGPVLYIFLKFVKDEKSKTLTLALVATIQIFILISTDFKKWSPHEWRDQWMEVEIPAEVKNEKALFLGVNTQSYAFLSMHLHKDSGLVNILGQYTIPYKDGLPDKLVNLAGKFNKKYVVLVTDGSGPIDDFLTSKNKLLLNYGWVGVNSCQQGAIKEPYADRFLKNQPMYALHFCPVVDASEDARKKQVAESIKYDEVFDHIEKNCDKFLPKNAATLTDGKTWIRQYVGTISSIYVEAAGVFAHGHRILHPAYLGNVEDILQSDPEKLCPDIYKKRYLN